MNNRTGVIRVWNASQKQPLELIKVSEAGFNSLIFLPNSEKALGAFKDGSVSVYNMVKRRIEWTSPSGHKETIFDILFKPSNKYILASRPLPMISAYNN